MNNIRCIATAILAFIIFTGETQDFSYDKKIGEAYSEQVELLIGTYEDSTLNRYVKSIGNRLVDVLGTPPVEFSFEIIDMPESNAFALPGGYIYVSRGLLSLINDESELACVLGHEIIHITKRHSVKQMRKSILPGLLQIPGAVVGVFNSNLGNIINAPVSFGGELFLSNYSRKQENESDKLGTKLASKAGYNPEKLTVLLTRISKDTERLTGEQEKKSYFSSHPYTPKRIENIDKVVDKLEWSEKKAIAPDKLSLYEKLDGMAYDQNPAQGIFDDMIFKHPGLNLTITFPENWNNFNTPIALGSTSPDGNAQLIFIVDEPGGDPDSLGIELSNRLQKEYNIMPEKSTPLTINGFPAYFVSAVDNSDQKQIKVQIYYLKVDGVLFNILGVSYLEHSMSISRIVHSVRPMTESERQNISYLKIRVAKAQESESLKTFTKRTNNQWDVETTALKNGIETNSILKEGQVLKIIVNEPYF